MKFTRLTLLIIMCVVTSSVMAKNKVVYYQPNSVNLIGVIKTLKYAGPPNYESIKEGDALETGSYVILDEPIDVKTLPKIQIGNDVFEKNVRFIQLIIRNDDDRSKVEDGNYVSLTGTLSRALTGHHHARVLITIKKIEVLSTHKIIDYKLNITDEDRKFQKYQHLQH
jgi:hypothetical protein